MFDTENLTEKLEFCIMKLKYSGIMNKSKAYDILHEGHSVIDTDIWKASQIDEIIQNNLVFDNKLQNIFNFLEFANKIELSARIWEKISYDKAPDISEEEWGVHIAHCCEKHGCKYGNPKCPVETGKVKQKYPCETCRTSDD